MGCGTVLRGLTTAWAGVALGFLAGGCASSQSQPANIAPLRPLTVGGEASLTRDVNLPLQQGFAVPTLSAGTTWRNVKHVSQGQIYKPIDTVLMADDGGYFNGNQSEAELVENGTQIVGIYLPAEQKFVPAKEPASDCLTGVTP